MKYVEAEKERIKNTDYDRIFKPKKPRVGDILSSRGGSDSLQTNSLLINPSKGYYDHSNHSILDNPRDMLIQIDEEDNSTDNGTVKKNMKLLDYPIFRTPAKPQHACKIEDQESGEKYYNFTGYNTNNP